jgi:hypothetical protein
MWGIFLESVVIFKNYMGFHENGYLAGIYLFVLLYLWLTEKDKTKRAVFVYAPTILLILFFCPLFRKLFVRLLDDSETYYRLLWLLQMSVVSAYGMVKLCGRHKRIGLVVMCVAVIACGNYVYDSEHITKAENLYHLPQEAVELVDMIEPEEGRIYALVPADFIYYVRQYSTNIELPYGREMLISRWDYYHAMYEAMEEAQVIQTKSFVELTRQYPCTYVVLKEDRAMEEPLTEYGFEVYGQVGDYIVYKDMTLEESAEDAV